MLKIFPRFIFILLILSLILNLCRVLFFDTYSSLYLFWNLFLALIPYCISLYLLRTKQKVLSFFIFALFVLWLLFLPNAPYLITDLMHIGDSFIVPIWYDTLMYILYAILGLILFIQTLSHVESIFIKKFTKQQTNIFIYSAILLSSFGMYLGRSKELRFNSWEVISRPNHIFSNIFDIFLHPSMHHEAYLFTFVSFLFLSTFYFLWTEFRK